MAGKRRDPRPVSEQLAWIKRLPEGGGGDWGRGITQTVDSIEAEMAALETQLAQAEEERKRKMAAMRSTIKTRRRLLTDLIRRANREVELLYANTQIEEAKTGVAGADVVIEVDAESEPVSEPVDAQPTA